MPKQKCEICKEEVGNLKLHNKRKHSDEPIEELPQGSQEVEDKTNEILANLERGVSSVYKRLDEIESRLVKLEESKSQKPIESPIEDKKVPQPEAHYPVPVDYIEELHTLLNRKFGIKIEPMPDRPQFGLTIIVPREYSMLNAKEWETEKGDFRTRMLNYTDGINGVREWIQKVYNSFSPELRVKIKSEI